MAKPNFQAIIEAAVSIEDQSYALYKMALDKAGRQSSKNLLAELAAEELKHKSKLLGIMENKGKLSKLGSAGEKIQDLKIVDVLKDTSLTEDADYQQVLVYAAKREKATYDYYRSLALGLGDSEVGSLFSRLAQEELGHKFKLEREYDDYVLREN